VYSLEVEAVVSEHPDVAEAAVIGLPDERWSERVHAAVVARPGATVTAAGIIEFARARSRSLTQLENRPLAGLRVLDLTLGDAALIARILADLVRTC
jgi:acyl-CoA synthetase (AMP-forming)/AMP-acid ligase II